MTCLAQLFAVISLLAAECSASILFPNDTYLKLDGLIPMADGKQPMDSRDLLEVHVSRTGQREKRQVIAGRWYHWPSSRINYRVWGGDSRFKQLIRSGLRMWEADTCLRFINNPSARDGIRYVVERGDSCFTEYIGRIGGQQDIIIGSECAEGYVVAHETGHALGFWHTHQRPDRQNHVTINWKNVRDEATASFMPYGSMLRAFDIRDISNRVVPYDYGSLMHYHAVAHARKVSDFTIVPRELKYVTTMGTERMGFLDSKVINDIYCSHMCRSYGRLTCHNGGYQDPNNCNKCKCPEGLGGRDCQQLQTSNCGRELRARRQWQVLESPERGGDCFWRITSVSRRVRFRLSDGDFPCSYGCQSYVEIKHKRDMRLTGFRSCCYRPKEDTISETNTIIVIYHPNGRTAKFSLMYIAA